MAALDLLLHVLQISHQLLYLALTVIYIVVRESVRNLFPKKKDVAGEVVLITGSAHGMGRELALLMARAGAKVVLWDVNEQKLKEVAKEIESDGGTASWYVCDVTSENEVNAKARLVQKDVGDVTILVNNAGIMQNLPILELNSSRIRQTLEVNLLAHFWTIRAFLPDMEKNQRGHIVAIASGAGLVGHVNQTDYSASKYGVVGLMEALSEELRLKGSDSIKFTTICPMTVNTGMNQNPITKCSWLAPVVEVDAAARQILSAIRREDFIVTIPRRMLFSFRVAKIFPHQVMSEFLDFTDYCRVKNSDSRSNLPQGK